MISRMEELPIAEARANLSEITSRVRHTREPVRLTRRGSPQAAIVTAELGDAAEAAGGLDKAAEILRQAAGAGK
jgi:prevent-host-death family protein